MPVNLLSITTTLAACAPLASSPTFAETAAKGIQLNPIATLATGIFNDAAAEIVAHDPGTQRIFVTNVADGTLDVFDISDPANQQILPSIDVTPYGDHASSVAAYRGTIAAAVEASVKTDPGSVVFFDAATGNFLSQVTVGALPDMLSFTPNGRAVLVANEGEPNDDYTIDREGSVNIIDLQNGPGARARRLFA